MNNQSTSKLSSNIASAVLVQFLSSWKSCSYSRGMSTPFDIEAVLPTGIDVLEHNYTEVPLETLQTMIDRNVSWVPTLAVIHRPNGSETIACFVQMGGRVAMGTDAGFLMSPGLSMAEIKALANSGMSPMDVIVASTRNSAYVCGVSDRLGTIKPGKIADLLVVTGNPLQDLGALTNIQLVMHQGTVVSEPEE